MEEQGNNCEKLVADSIKSSPLIKLMLSGRYDRYSIKQGQKVVHKNVS